MPLRLLFGSRVGAVVSVALLLAVVPASAAAQQDALSRHGVLGTQSASVAVDASDASLASLSLTGADLAFDADQSQYWVAYGVAVQNPTIVATAAQPGAQVEFRPADADPDTAGYQARLSGLQAVHVIVTSPDESARRIWSIWLFDYRLTALSVEGFDLGFDPATADYSLEVPHSNAAITLTAGDGDHTFAYSHPDADSAADGHQVALEPGDNTVTVTATPKARIVAVPQTYTITVTRLPDPSEGLRTGDPLTGTFAYVPQSHSGSRGFTLGLLFSDDVSTSFQELRYWTIKVIGGRLQHMQLMDSTNTARWYLLVTPSGDYDVTISLEAGQSCGDIATVCTADGRVLSHDMEVTVVGPNGSATHPSVASSEVYLVFDDGPQPEFTPRVLDVLKRHGAKATFFVTGVNASAHPDIVQRAANEGHTFGNHTWNHEVLTELTLDEFNSTINRTQETLGDHATDCLRPPLSASDHNVVEWAQALGMRIVPFTVNTRDWQLPGAEVIADRIVWGAVPGSVISLHDVGATGEQTAEALDLALTRLADSGLNFVPHCNVDRPAPEPSTTREPSTTTEPPTASEPPAAPTRLTAAVNDDGHIVLSWDAASDTDAVTGYQILRRRPREGENTLTVYVGDTGSAANTYTDTAAPAGTLYVYRVKAHNGAGTSARSNYVNVDHNS